MRGGPASPPQRAQLHEDGCTRRGGAFLPAEAVRPGWSPVLSTQTESGEGRPTFPGAGVATSEVVSAALLLSQAPRPWDKVSPSPWSPRRAFAHITSYNPTFSTSAPFFLLQLHPAPISTGLLTAPLPPHSCSPLCPTLLQLAHHCHKDGPERLMIMSPL